MSDTISGLNSSYLNGTYTNSTTSALESTLNNKDLSTSSSDELMEVCKDFEEYFNCKLGFLKQCKTVFLYKNIVKC